MTAGILSGPSTGSSSLPGMSGGLLASILNEDAFRPAEPRSIEETGLTASLVETLMLKYVLLIGSACGMACFKWLDDRQFAFAVNLLLIASGLSFLL